MLPTKSGALFTQLKNKAFLYNLKKKLSEERKGRNVISYEDSSHIGILFDATQPEDRVLASQFAAQLRGEGKKVKILGFINKKMETENLPFQNFMAKDLSWNSIPKRNGAINNFLEYKYDYLLGLYTQESQPLDYLATVSNSSFRIGPYHSGKLECYDFMIVSDDNTPLSFFIREVERFLKMVNRDDQ